MYHISWAYMTIAADEARNTPSSSLHTNHSKQDCHGYPKIETRMISWKVVDFARSRVPRSRGLAPKPWWSDIIGSSLVSLKLSRGGTSCHPFRCRSEFRALQCSTTSLSIRLSDLLNNKDFSSVLGVINRRSTDQLIYVRPKGLSDTFLVW